MKLTKREKEILKLLSRGYSNKEIAQKLEISLRTVQTHMDRVILKLNARNRIAAVATYLKKYA